MCFDTADHLITINYTLRDYYKKSAYSYDVLFFQQNPFYSFSTSGLLGFPGGANGKEPTCQCRRHRQETWVLSLGWEDPLEEGMATHSSILAWRIPMGSGAWWATVMQ